MQGELNGALKKAIESLKDAAPVQTVLAAAVLAQHLQIKLEKSAIEKLSAIIKRNGDLHRTLMGLDDSVRR